MARDASRASDRSWVRMCLMRVPRNDSAHILDEQLPCYGEADHSRSARRAGTNALAALNSFMISRQIIIFIGTNGAINIWCSTARHSLFKSVKCLEYARASGSIAGAAIASGAIAGRIVARSIRSSGESGYRFQRATKHRFSLRNPHIQDRSRKISTTCRQGARLDHPIQRVLCPFLLERIVQKSTFSRGLRSSTDAKRGAAQS